MADSLIISPPQMYQINEEVSKIKSAVARLGVGANSQIIAGITGSRIRVMGWKIQSTSAIGTFQLKSASGGTALTPVFTAPPHTQGESNELLLTNSGYFETNTSEGLFVDVAANAVEFLIFYLTYKPLD